MYVTVIECVSLVNLQIYCGDFNISGTAECSTHAVVQLLPRRSRESFETGAYSQKRNRKVLQTEGLVLYTNYLVILVLTFNVITFSHVTLNLQNLLV